MRTLATYLPGLICAGGMLLCMQMMRHGSKSNASCHETSKQETASSAEMAELREEITRLRAELMLKSRQEELRA